MARGPRSRGRSHRFMYFPTLWKNTFASLSCTCIARCSRNCNHRCHSVSRNRVILAPPRPTTCHSQFCYNDGEELRIYLPSFVCLDHPVHKFALGPQPISFMYFGSCRAAQRMRRALENLWQNGTIGLGNSTTVGSFSRVDQGL